MEHGVCQMSQDLERIGGVCVWGGGGIKPQQQKGEKREMTRNLANPGVKAPHPVSPIQQHMCWGIVCAVCWGILNAVC